MQHPSNKLLLELMLQNLDHTWSIGCTTEVMFGSKNSTQTLDECATFFEWAAQLSMNNSMFLFLVAILAFSAELLKESASNPSHFVMPVFAWK
jgi:hypothetical protein